jgi:hypothetical protein
MVVIIQAQGHQRRRSFRDRDGEGWRANWTVVADEHPGSAENRKIPFASASRR